jgi:hypothetical protein
LEEMMRIIGSIVLLVGLLAFSACNQAGKSGAGGAVVTKADSKSAPAASKQKASAANRPTSVTLASGETLPVVGVVKLDSNPKAHSGEVAVMGLVETVLADRGAFTLVECGAEVGCKDGCCPAAKFPVVVPQDRFEGKLPELNQEVIVIGKLTPAETGYSFDVHEVRLEEAVLLKPRDPSSAPADA